MDDSDDYFQDDIILDDEALAILEKEERKVTETSVVHLTNSRGVVRPSPFPLPATKRLKTDGGWRPTQGTLADPSNNALDSFEISVQGDGSYGVQGGGSRPADKARDLRESNDSLESETGQERQNPTLNRPRSVHAHPSTTRTQTRSAVHEVPFMPMQQDVSSQNTLDSHLQRTQAPIQPHTRPLLPSGAMLKSPPPNNPSDNTSHSTTDINIQVDIITLQNRLEELHRANEAAQRSLKEAQDARFAKEGEVSILRKGMEKKAQEHAEDLAKLKAAKEAVETKHFQLEREMKDEMERLRTQFTFKQHELEMSARKPPWSARSKKRIGSEFPPTPVPLPSQMRGWNRVEPGQSKHFKQTPPRPYFGTHAKESPNFRRSQKPQNTRSAEKLRKPLSFPGFENSFAPSSPVHSPTVPHLPVLRKENLKGKGKGKAEEVDEFQMPFATSSSPAVSYSYDCGSYSPSKDSVTKNRDSPIRGTEGEPNKGEDGATIANLGFNDENVDMVDDSEDTESPDDPDGFEGADWAHELRNIIFTHSYRSLQTLTFQELLIADLPAHTRDTYAKTCTATLTVLGSHHQYGDRNALWSAVSRSLIHVMYILNTNGVIATLTPLLNLLKTLVISLPSFASLLLVVVDHEAPDQPRILNVLCNLIRRHLPPMSKDSGLAGGNDDSSRIALAEETLGLLEAISLHVSEGVEKLALIPRSEGVLTVLLNPKQPAWVLSRTARILVVLATRPILFRALLSFPDSETQEEAGKDYSRIPHIERLSGYLADTTQQGPDVEMLKTSILNFVAMLSISHADALSLLLESQTLIPAVVLFLTHTASLLWEDDEALMNSPATASDSVKTLHQTLHLLHHLVFTPDPPYNLAQKLHHSPYRQFNGLMHMFVVTIGRLSFAEPPEWLTDGAKGQIEQMAELARDLLDFAVEGPEWDSIWAAYQWEPDAVASMTDEEEMGAMLMDLDDDA